MVVLEACNLRERLVACHANIRLIPSVASLVVLQVAPLRERLPAEAAFKWFLSCMSHHMMLQIALLRKSTPTFLAGVGTLASVASLMAAHTGHLSENLAAIRARIRL